MPDNRCDLVFIQSSELPSSTKPLRVITHYPSADDLSMQSPGRPTTLGVCLTTVHHNKDGKFEVNGSRIAGLDENSQSWSAKMVDNGDFEKLLGQLGSNGSTPVTPTSFLNPRNITEDQEIFADNFSRTLNKVKAEQEGWAATEDGSHVRPHSHSPAITLNNTQSTFGDSCRTTSELPASSLNASQTPRGSNRVNPGSPQPIDQSLAPSSTASNSSMLPQIPTASMPVSEIEHTHLLSKTLLPTTKFDLNHTSANILSSTTTNTTWTTGLPTILSIASGLKDVYADRNDLVEHSHQPLIIEADHPRSMHSSSPEPILFGLDSRSGVNGGKRSTNSNSAFLLHYTTVSDTHTVEQTSPSNGSNSSLNRRDVSPFGTQTPQNPAFTAHEEVYSGAATRLRSESSLTSGLNLLPSIISTMQKPPVGLAVSSGMQPPTVAFLLTASSATPGRLIYPTDGKQSSSATVCARVMTAGSTSSSSESTGSRLATDVVFPQIVPSNSAMNILQDASTGALLINSNAQLQQLTALYPSLNGTLDLATTDDLHHSFAFHPNINGGDASISLNFAPALTGLSEVSLFGSSSQKVPPTTTTRINSAQADSSRSEAIMGHTSVRSPFPQISTGSTVGQSGDLLNATTTINVLTTIAASSSSSTGSQLTSGFGNLTHNVDRRSAKKTKRSGGGKKALVCNTDKTDMLAGLQSTASVCDSSTSASSYLTPNPLYSPDSKKIGLKRPRESCGLPVPTQSSVSINQINPAIFPSMQSSASDAATYVHQSLPSQLVYLTHTDHTVHVKPEATVPGESIDDVSTHSESVSAELCGGGGTTTAQSGQTPPSSVDEYDHNHIKLERKRARNRVAARRCRERKISLIRALENQVAERDAHVRCLEDLLSRYRSEGERLRKHMELLASSYPSLKAELYQYPFLFQQQQQHNSTPTELPGLGRSSSTEFSAELVSTKHFS